jgi:[protein-PII] uridylyltransferase
VAQPKEKNGVQTLAEISPPYLTDALVEFQPGADVTLSVKDYFTRGRRAVMEKLDAGVPAVRVVRLQSLMVDRLLVTLFKEGFEEKPPIALFALGGYGRAELNLYSDIDLLFLYEGKAGAPLEAVVKKMLYPLWDAQEAIGYATRTIADCKRIMAADARAMSSLLDARFLAGDRHLAEKFFRFLESAFASSKALQQFANAKKKEMSDRLKRFGGSVYVNEPNLKESEGGLRDWHMIRYYARIALKTDSLEEWVHAELFSPEEADLLDRSLNFLLAVRNRLHRLAGRCQDQLQFESQKAIAREMGYQDDADMLGVERFMQVYYGHAAGLHKLLEEATRRLLKPPSSPLRLLKRKFKKELNDFFFQIDSKVVPRSHASIEKHPLQMLEAFYLAQCGRITVDEEFKSWVGRHLYLVDDAYRGNPQVGERMREMFADLGGIGESLWRMHDCRFFGALIPEFGDILFQTQHDAYHVYTVDTHSIMAVEELSKLSRGVYDREFPVLKKALEECPRPGVLAWGVLCHDIGKGKGGSHSEKGAVLAQAITRRLGYTAEERAEIEFLVRSHLLMPLLSQRRDLEDANLITQFAKSLGTMERLNNLFVLTWADIRAVGPEVWTPWKGALLQQLYAKTRSVFEIGEFSAERAADHMRQAKRKVRDLAPEGFDLPGLDAYLDTMPPRYFLAVKPLRILRHFEHIRSVPSGEILFHPRPDPDRNLTRLLIHTLNSPRLFEQVTGVLAASQVNILAFEQFFRKTGEVLILLKVTDSGGQAIEEERRLKALGEDLSQVLQGELPVEQYTQLHQSRLLTTKRVAQTKPPRVEVDNDVSAYYTVIDIFANDRIGLLHDLARAMTKLGLYIEVSKISTKVDQVADVFYVKDIFGHKITDAKKIAGIRKELLETLTMEPGEGG